MLLLGIETSCDETAASVVRDGTQILSDVVVSQIDTHKAYGGVVPELASRKHVEAISVVIDQALDRAGVQASQLEGIGVTSSRYKLYALTISAFFTSICGSFYAQYILHIEPSTVMSVDISIKVVLIAVLGGAGSIWGPLLGAIILLPLSEYSRIWLGGTGKGIDLIIFGALIVLISIFRPSGIVGIFKTFRIKARNS